MENESPAKSFPLNLTTNRSIERNVLKEINQIEETTKSPKEAAAAEVIVSSAPTETRLDVDSKAVNKNLLRVATPTDFQSDDEEFVDCNSTFRSSQSSINNETIDNAINESEETFRVSENRDLSVVNDTVDELTSCFNRKLNLGFIENRNHLQSNSEDSETTATTDRSNTTISSSAIDDSRGTIESAPNASNEEIVLSESAAELNVQSEPESQHKQSSPSELKQQPEIQSKPSIESETLESKASDKIDLECDVIESNPEIVYESSSEEKVSNQSFNVEELQFVEEAKLTEQEAAEKPENLEQEADNVTHSDREEKAQFVKETESAGELTERAKEEASVEEVNVVDRIEEPEPIIVSKPETEQNSTKDAETSVKEVNEPINEPLEPSKQAEECVEDVEQPLKEVEEPVKEPIETAEELVEKPEESVKESENAEEPAKETLSPVERPDTVEIKEPVEHESKTLIQSDANTNSEFVQVDKTLNETCTVPDSPIRQQNITFGTNEAATEKQIEIPECDGNTLDSQAKKIKEFKAKQAHSADSLELDSDPKDCSIDSLEMKPNEPATIDSDITFAAEDNFKVPINVDNGSPSIASPLNKTISKLTHQETFNVSSPASDSDASNDVTVIVNKASIESSNSPNRMKRSGTFDILNVDDDVDLQSTLEPDVLPNAAVASVEDGGCAISKRNVASEEQPHGMVLSSSDFDFLQSRGVQSIEEEDRRSSLLLTFDPLPGRTVERQQLGDTQETIEIATEKTAGQSDQLASISENSFIERSQSHAANASEMSVRLVHDSNNMDNETNSYTKTDIVGDVPLSDKKINFDYADENIRKKMEEYEATQEILVKRLAEKEKTLAKNCAIIEAYEKALAELVADKEKLTEHHELANEQVRQERDLHHQHLTSLEITFSDLHKKYERSKEIALQLRERYDLFVAEKATIDEMLKQQEIRYEKMKQHALQQLEYANSTLEEQEKNNVRENSRLKALLKIEEVSRNTMQEQLAQKCKENEELVKICDELIGGGQRS